MAAAGLRPDLGRKATSLERSLQPTSGAVPVGDDSRVYAGIHDPMDLDAGFEIARKVAARAREVGIPKDKPFMPLGR